ncbi:MAG TPA: exopolyphosphatase [Cyanobacteria bacterium UBA8530]|nr:exopolyphosphatase [Cyanobacteria bacterium UBA8530]
MSKKYRLVTRSDMDGLVCAVLLRELDILGEVKFVHPKDVQDGKIEFTPDDITTNLPYVPNVHISFDHHSSEITRVEAEAPNHVIEAHAPSTARVVYNYFGGKARFPDIREDMLLAVDKADSAQFSREDILQPQGWDLLSFLMDPRTGLGRFREFRIANYALMMDLIAYCKNHTIEEIMQLPDVKQRTDLYFAHQEQFKAQLMFCTTVHKNVVVLDLREEDPIFAGNRFMIYALFPECNVSIHTLWGLKKQNTVFAIGKSIFNKSSKIDIGDLALAYGGGGHENAGTCQIPNEKAEEVLKELIGLIKANG